MYSRTHTQQSKKSSWTSCSSLLYQHSRHLHVNKTSRVFSNAEVNLGDVEVLGFDYDFTLVSYTHQLQQLVYDTAKFYASSKMNLKDEFVDYLKI